MIELIALDPATATLIETLVVTGFMVCASVCALLLLPWTDAEISEVDEAFHRNAFTVAAKDAARSAAAQLTAASSPVVSARPAATRTIS